MKLVNLAVESFGTKIKTYSSCLDISQQPSNILNPSQNTLWATGEGIPQFVIVSLQDLTVSFKNICEVGFMLWHDYDTNPKQIQLWVAETTEQQFVFWARFELEQKKGIQLYEIKPLPQKYIYLKISITETYGAFQTYLNQVFFMADQVRQLINKPQTHKEISSQKEKNRKLDLEDLQSDLNHLIEIDRKISRSKSHKKKQQQKKLNKIIRENQMEKQLTDDNLLQKQTKLDTYNQSRQQFSKGSLSSNNNNKPGRSIYFRSSDYNNNDEDDNQSHQYISNEYQSSSSNTYHHNNNIGVQKQKNKISSQQSEQFSNSLQSQSLNAVMRPFVNNFNSQTYNNVSEKHKFFNSKQNKKPSNRRQIDDQRKGESKKKTKDYSYNDDEEQLEDEDVIIKRNKQRIQIEEESLVDEEVEQQQQVNQNAFQQFNRQEFSHDLVKNTPKYKQLSSQHYRKGSQSDQSHHNNSQASSHEQNDNYNVAILALSKHVVKLQDNMESIQRKVQVLDLKVAHSHQKIHQEIIEKVQNKVQQIIDRKLRKIWSLKNLNLMISQNHSGAKLKERHGNQQDSQNKKHDQLKLDYKKNLTKQFFKNDYYNQQQNLAQMRDRTKTKRRNKQKYVHYQQPQRIQPNEYSNERLQQRRLKASKSFANITNHNNKYNNKISNTNEITLNKQKNNADKKSKQGPDQQYIACLLQRLNAKLKEREVKLNRMQKNRSKQEQQYGQNHIGKKRYDKLKEKRRDQYRAIANHNEYY